MNWTTKGVAALVAGTALFCGMGSVTAVALTGHHGTAPARRGGPCQDLYPPAAVTPPAPKTTVPAPAPAPKTIDHPEAGHRSAASGSPDRCPGYAWRTPRA